MKYIEPKMLISMFDDEDDILTESGVNAFGLGEAVDNASDAAGKDVGGSDATYSIDVKTFD
ncbi:MAG: hypothetical protein SOS24_07310 [Clostridia bacterium]|nr:hypothetical protein [Clostridia bacterium]